MMTGGVWLLAIGLVLVFGGKTTLIIQKPEEWWSPSRKRARNTKHRCLKKAISCLAEVGGLLTFGSGSESSGSSGLLGTSSESQLVLFRSLTTALVCGDGVQSKCQRPAHANTPPACVLGRNKQKCVIWPIDPCWFSQDSQQLVNDWREVG